MDTSNGSSQQFTEVNALNSKLAYDLAAQLQGQALLDNQQDSRAWAAFRLRVAEDGHTVRHLAQLAALATDQTGQTENENLVKPTPNAIVDDTSAVAAGAENSATAQSTLANVTAQVAELVAQVTGLAATVAQIVANAGVAGAKTA